MYTIGTDNPATATASTPGATNATKTDGVLKKISRPVFAGDVYVYFLRDA